MKAPAKHVTQKRAAKASSGSTIPTFDHLEDRMLMSSVLAPTADAFVQGGGYAAYNYGNSTVLSLKNDSNASYDTQSYLRFNLSSLSGTVQSATLTLTPVATGTKMGSFLLRIRLLADSSDGWTEGNGGSDNNPTGELTWNNKPTGLTNYVTISGKQLAVGRSVNVDVTSLIKQSGNTNGVASFVIDVISAANSRQWVSFASRENTNALYRPKLTMTMAAPTPTPAPTPVTVSVPNAPSSLTASSISSSQINLAWTDNSSNETGFILDRATDSGFTQNLTTTALGSNVTSYNATSLSSGTNYYFRIRATNSAGNSANSNTANAATAVVITIPTAPTSLTASSISSSQINLSWADNSSNETGFKLDRATDSGFTQNLTTTLLGTNATTYNTTGLTSGTTYYFRVRATDTAGDSANSNTANAATAVVITIPTAPASLTATSISSSQINLAWADKSSNETGFKLDRATDSGFTQNLASTLLGSNVTSYSATGLASGTTYYFRVRATNTAGDSANSNTANAATAVIIAPATNSLNLQNSGLAGLVQNLDADGSINRSDMIQILRYTGTDGTVSAGDLSDLQIIVKNASTLKMPGYVQVLANDVVNGNTANAHYQGATLGNLAAGSSATQLNTLVNKWFYGTDHPTTDSGLTYKAAGGSLFVNGPTYTDEKQGYVGDCYFISSMGSIAQSSPAAIQNMFIDNGDGTFTVRFYYNGTPDFVTVDRMLPTDSGGNLYYDGMGQSASTAEMWLPLAEKAYAQWNETGKEGRNGTNTYSALAGGWMYNVDAQVLGKSASNYFGLSSSGYQNALISALSNGLAVTMGTNSTGGDGLYGSHAYSVVSYNATNGTFQLNNPWGFSNPGPLTYAQLTNDCVGFVVATASGTVAAATMPAVSGAAPAGLFSSMKIEAPLQLRDAA